MYCDEIEDIITSFMKELEDIQYKCYLKLYNPTAEISSKSVQTARRSSLVNKVLGSVGLHLMTKKGYEELLNTLKRLTKERMGHLSFKRSLHGELFLNQRALGLLRTFFTKTKDYVEVCESFADNTSKEAYVEYLKSIISSALGLTPCMLVKIKCCNPDKLNIEDKGIKYLGRGKYADLFNIKDKFNIENDIHIVKEVFAFENYKDPYHNILPYPKDMLYLDVGAYMGENIAWASLYSESSTGYAIEPEPKLMEVTRYNLTSPERAGKWLKERNFDVKFVQEYVSKENHLGKLIDPKDLKRHNNYVLKVDIEGYEKELLDGSKEFLGEFKPTLTIAAYHRGDDLLVLPKLILDANDSYKLYLRPHQYAWTIILFAT